RRTNGKRLERGLSGRCRHAGAIFKIGDGSGNTRFDADLERLGWIDGLLQVNGGKVVQLFNHRLQSRLDLLERRSVVRRQQPVFNAKHKFIRLEFDVPAQGRIVFELQARFQRGEE